MKGEFEGELRALLDEREIRNVLMRYCRGVDRSDLDLMASCFHDDAQDDHGNWIARGPEIAKHILSTVQPGPAKAMHFMGNVSIELDGDRAFTEAYVLAFRSFERDEKAFTRVRAVRFVDRFERREGVWKVAERVVVDDWNRVDAVVETQPETSLFRPSSKDKSDPVYALKRGPVARTKL